MYCTKQYILKDAYEFARTVKPARRSFPGVVPRRFDREGRKSVTYKTNKEMSCALAMLDEEIAVLEGRGKIT